jgi:hypothetical protein
MMDFKIFGKKRARRNRGISPAFSWRDWEQLRRISGSRAGISAEIRIGHIPNTSQDSYRYANLLVHKCLHYWRLMVMIWSNLSIYLDWPQAAALWRRLTPTLHALIGLHPLHKKQILYGHTTLDTTPQQLANYLLALAKTTIYKTYVATNNTHTQNHQTTNACYV